MIFYPLNTLLQAGIKDILIIVSPEHSGLFLNLLRCMLEPFGIKISFRVQQHPNGFFLLGATFIDSSPVALIFGDNIFADDISQAVQQFTAGCHVFLKNIDQPERFGEIHLINIIVLSRLSKNQKTLLVT